MNPSTSLLASIAALGLALVTDLAAQDSDGPAAAVPESLQERISYSYGISIGQQLRDREIPIDLDQFLAAFETALNGGESLLSEEERNEAFDQMAQLKVDEMKAAGEKYLADNAKKDGVEVTGSGLQYEVLAEGDGPKPKETDRVTVHYHGTLIDGTVFDSSVERGTPATFGLNQVIPGWTEGVQLMPKGSKFRFHIPYDLAYGERGAGSDIKPYSALVFEVELLKINGE